MNLQSIIEINEGGKVVVIAAVPERWADEAVENLIKLGSHPCQFYSRPARRTDEEFVQVED